MTMFQAQPQKSSDCMSRFDGGELLRFMNGYGPRGVYDEPSAAPPHMAAVPEADRYRICLDCALPLRTQEQTMEAECHCALSAEMDDDWLAFSGVERAFILGLALAWLTVIFWFCL